MPYPNHSKVWGRGWNLVAAVSHSWVMYHLTYISWDLLTSGVGVAGAQQRGANPYDLTCAR